MIKSPQVFETAFASYEYVRQIGEGGSGVVFEVKRHDGAPFAVKVLKGTTRDKSARFKNEIAFCARAAHKNILRVEDSGLTDIDGAKLPFCIMKHYPKTLRSWSPPLQAKLPTFAQILDGVEAAHLQRVWHRDLKPENILIADEGKTVVVSDFGIAHFAESLLVTAVETAPGSRLANFQYAAPEQRISGRAVDQRADIYALGLILNELFTGQVPHGSGYVRISAMATEFAFLDDLVDQMIRQDPGDRPESIDVIKAALIARQQQFVTRQRISKLEAQVVPVTSIDDPLVATPVTITSLDYRDGSLTLNLSSKVTQEWQDVFRTISFGHCVWNCEPSAYGFNGDYMYIRVDHAQAQQVVTDSKRFVAIANAEYKRKLEIAARKKDAHERELLRRGLEAENARLKLLQSLKL